MEAEERVKSFESSIPWHDYQSASFGLLAFVRGERLFNLRSWIIFDTRAPSSELEIEGAGNGLVVCRGRSDLGSIRQSMRQGNLQRLELGNRKILFQTTEDDRPYHWSASNTVEQARQSIGWPAFGLTGSGENLWKTIGGPGELRRIEELLPMLRPDRFTSWNQLSTKLGLGTEISESISSCTEIFAPIYGRLGKPRVDLVSGVIEVDVECRINPIEANMEVVFAPVDTRHEPLQCPAAIWRETPADHTWAATTRTSPASGRLSVQLLSGNRRIWQESTAGPPLRARVQAALDPEVQWLRGLLFPAKRSSGYQNDFEQGVLALLGLGGLPAVHYGHSGRDRFPDVVACTDDGQIAVLECTVESPTARKLAALAARAAQLGQQVALNGERVPVLAAMVVPVVLGDLPREIALEAHKLGVRVIAREGLERLLELALTGEQPDSIVAMIASASPLQR